MNLKPVKDILKLNSDFYQSISEEFSKSRQKPWIGWDRVLENIQLNINTGEKDIKILDLGCGNGRFYNYIKGKIKNIDYTGVDINNDFIKECVLKYSDGKFISEDIFTNLKKINGKYNIVVAFGVTHHIPNEDFRYKWFSTIPELLDKKGILVMTFWLFNDKPGDYLLGWKKEKDLKRYCHQYSNAELEELVKTYKRVGLKLVDRFVSDKKNVYLIFLME